MLFTSPRPKIHSVHPSTYSTKVLHPSVISYDHDVAAKEDNEDEQDDDGDIQGAAVHFGRKGWKHWKVIASPGHTLHWATSPLCYTVLQNTNALFCHNTFHQAVISGLDLAWTQNPHHAIVHCTSVINILVHLYIFTEHLFTALVCTALHCSCSDLLKRQFAILKTLSLLSQPTAPVSQIISHPRKLLTMTTMMMMTMMTKMILTGRWCCQEKYFLHSALDLQARRKRENKLISRDHQQPAGQISKRELFSHSFKATFSDHKFWSDYLVITFQCHHWCMEYNLFIFVWSSSLLNRHFWSNVSVYSAEL